MSSYKRRTVAILLAFAFAGISIDVVESQDAGHRSVLVRVVDADDQPVTDVDVLLIFRNAFTVEEKKFETDADGVAIVKLPIEAQRVTINILKSGYVPIANRWRIPGHEVPDALDFQLQKGTTIGGEVRNTRGEPVTGAKVAMKIHSPLTSFYDDSESKNLFILEAKHAPVTNDDGRWTYSGVPADAEVRISVTHPDYSGDQDFTTSYERASQRDLREQSSLALLADGIRIHGLVLSSDGQPVSDADLSMRMAPPNYSPTLQAKSDSSGKFQLPATRAGKYVIAIGGKGFSPEFATYDTDSKRLPLRIRLTSGRTVRLRVVDSEERPVQAQVSLNKCAGMDGGLLYYPTPLVPAQTDVAGRFEWNNAPQGELVFSVDALGFEAAESTVAAEAAPTETVVKLQREAVFTGRVIDRKTKKPIDRFMVVPFVANQSIWRPTGVVGRDGTFQMPVRQFSPDYSQEFHLMIEHAGHRTVLTDETFGKSKDTKEILIEMDPAEPISGLVVDDEGKPVAKAQVSIAESPSGLFPSRSMVFGVATTDKSGAFQFPAPPDDFSVVALGSAGYVQKRFRSDRSQLGELQLQPWGTVEGKVVDRDGKPCPDFIVVVAPQKNGNAKPPAQTKTDQQGRFKLEHVPPVACRVSAYSQPKQGVASAAVEKKFSVPPGDVVTVDLKLD